MELVFALGSSSRQFLHLSTKKEMESKLRNMGRFHLLTKIFESILNKTLRDFEYKYKMSSDKQYESVQDKCTQNAISELT